MRSNILVAAAAASVTAIIGIVVISVMSVSYYEPKPVTSLREEDAE